MVSGKQSPLSQRPEAVPYAVGLYITAAYWFTASTSFANPAVTIARSLSDTFAGIAPGGVAAFVVAQLAGMLVAVGLSRRLWRKPKSGHRRRGRHVRLVPKRTFALQQLLLFDADSRRTSPRSETWQDQTSSRPLWCLAWCLAACRDMQCSRLPVSKHER